MIIEYKASVMVAAGWRSVTIKASVIQTSAKMCEVVEVISIDGEAPTGYTSRTGASRQTYNAAGIAKREEGKRKRIGSVDVVEAV